MYRSDDGGKVTCRDASDVPIVLIFNRLCDPYDPADITYPTASPICNTNVGFEPDCVSVPPSIIPIVPPNDIKSPNSTGVAPNVRTHSNPP
jgi:hypothetical protein